MAALAPNGKWLAYVSSESGREEVYVRSFPGLGAAVQVSEKGGNEPVWARDGRRLFYRTGSALMDATISDASGFAVTARDSLFRDTFVGGMPHANYAVLPDARHFVMFGTGSEAGPEAIVVVNWLREFRATLAASR
jgi:serine/threonine-protein kinase